ncbi:MAG: thioredoxin family protein [Agriterribacter sp.]
MQISGILLVLYAVLQLHGDASAQFETVNAQSHTNPYKKELTWLTLEEAEAKIKEKKKPVLIDLYTDWCGWCKVMDKKTYSNPEVIKYIEENFYPVKIDAETRNALSWKNKSYSYNAQYKINSFAVFLTNGQLSFPTTIILTDDNTIPQAIPGYLKVADMELILRYFGDGHFGKTPFEDYRNAFSATWK